VRFRVPAKPHFYPILVIVLEDQEAGLDPLWSIYRRILGGYPAQNLAF
jgi:hypothetical protein